MQIGTAIDLSGLGLDTIEETEEEFRIGCMVTLPGFGAGSWSFCIHGWSRQGIGPSYRRGPVPQSCNGGRKHIRAVWIFGCTDDVSGNGYLCELYKGGIIPLKEYAKLPYDRDILVRLIVKKEKSDFHYQSVRNSQTEFPGVDLCGGKNRSRYRFAIGARPGKSRSF